jgi:ATP-dependent DNA helicase RecG
MTNLPGVGAYISAQLEKLGIETLEDVLLHLPLRYENRTHLVEIQHLSVGRFALVEAVVVETEVTASKKRLFICTVTDSTGTLYLKFFHFFPSQMAKLSVGTCLRCFGEVRQGNDCVEMIHPQYEILNPEIPSDALQQHLTAIYPSSGNLTQSLLQSLVKQAFEQVEIIDYIPQVILDKLHFMSLREALALLHFPAPQQSIESLQNPTHPARRRLAFEELLAQHLSLRALRVNTQRHLAPKIAPVGELAVALFDVLPFCLTRAQQRVFDEICDDLAQTRPMLRLVQGDVGSGKTVVAALAALQAVEAGYQVAVMAPTELLAEQHKQTFTDWLTPLNLRIAWLSGSLTKKKREQALAEIAAGDIAIAIGTHALFQEKVTFAKLGLVVIDEQHRFGVHQRLALRNKGAQQNSYPHQLIMTATPIPRTLAMTAYADLDTSVIDELPAGRVPINTAVIPNTRRNEIIARIRQVCQYGRQAYWVCPLIEESDKLQLQAAEDTAQYLTAVLPDLPIGLVHGRMKSKDKEAVMARFKQGDIAVLVATTVIEVGVDVPNASLMIIENAERLGLAQLHQLRGRVGRGAQESFCVLLYQLPLSDIAKIRLGAIRESHDGFLIAQRDLEIRGPGEVLGTKQTGVMNLRIADLERDQAFLNDIVPIADELLAKQPAACNALIKRWIKSSLSYGQV